MVNEVAQWAIIGILGFLMLGLFRQIGMQLPPAVRAAVSGPDVGKKAPGRLVSRVRSTVMEGSSGPVLVAFVSENCVSCQRLLGNLQSREGRVDGTPIVLVAKDPSPAFRSALLQTGLPTINDTDGELWRECHVTATPLLVRVGEDGRVTGKEVTHDAKRLAGATA